MPATVIGERVLAFWVVDGSLRDDGVRPEYSVLYDSHARVKWTCTCPHHVYRKASCKHIQLCKQDARERCEVY